MRGVVMQAGGVMQSAEGVIAGVTLGAYLDAAAPATPTSLWGNGGNAFAHRHG